MAVNGCPAFQLLARRFRIRCVWCLGPCSAQRLCVSNQEQWGWILFAHHFHHVTLPCVRSEEIALRICLQTHGLCELQFQWPNSDETGPFCLIRTCLRPAEGAVLRSRSACASGLSTILLSWRHPWLKSISFPLRPHHIYSPRLAYFMLRALKI